MEKSLQERLQGREERAYMELYDLYFRRLHRFAVGFVMDAEVAEDIVQETMIRLYERIGRGKPAGGGEGGKTGGGGKAQEGEWEENLGAYLGVMVRNRCLNYLRDRGVEDRNKVLYFEATMATEGLDWLQDEELIERVRKVVEGLPEKYREICELRFYGNLKFAEIAERLGVTENAAKVQVHRAIQKIKESLAGKEGWIVGLLMMYERD